MAKYSKSKLQRMAGNSLRYIEPEHYALVQIDECINILRGLFGESTIQDDWRVSERYINSLQVLEDFRAAYAFVNKVDDSQ